MGAPKKRAKPFSLDYNRVDKFTSEDGKLFFGEMSHSPNAFHNNYSPKEIDELLYKLYTKEVDVMDADKHLEPHLVYDKQMKLHEEPKKDEDLSASADHVEAMNTRSTEEVKLDKDMLMALVS